MMTNYDLSALEDAVISALKAGGVTSQVYADRPKSKETAAEFTVVSAKGQFDDKAAYANGNLYISLFAKDVENQKNRKKLGVLYARLIACMPAQIGRYMFSIHPVIVGDRADDYGFHARMVIFNVTIKVQ